MSLNRGNDNNVVVSDNEKINKKVNWMDVCILLFFVLYPMRHVAWGLDLWDTGYNYANFCYMGTDHMDSMWLFSTYLSNVVGHFMSVLPFGNTLVGMNVYTGLVLATTACIAYLFCTRKLQIPKLVAWVGETIAISLCWCPTALLYNYLTYLFYTICIVCLYKGLTEEKKGFLFAAGVCLGCNLFVRVSNLPEASLILAVWLYACISTTERFKKAIWYTGWCLGGYLAVVGAFLLVISIRYGFGNYVDGLGRLFAMTDKATDYKASSMLMGIIHTYLDSLYWVIRIMFFAVVGFVVDFAIYTILKSKREQSSSVRRMLSIMSVAIGVIMAGITLAWLLNRNFTSMQYRTYDPIFLTSILFLLYSMVVGFWLVIRPGSQKEERLMGAFVCLVVFFTSVGSNNKVFPSMNNLFWIAPYILWQTVKFMKFDAVNMFKVSLNSFKVVLATMIGLFGVQALLFGVFFSFAEATGMQAGNATVKGNSVLQGVKMSDEKAQWMQGISDFVSEHDLEGKEVILYGWIPSLSFYLQMPSAFNPWSDLDSYSYAAMEKDMEKLRNSGIKPVVIQGIDQDDPDGEELKEEDDPKWNLICEFMEDNGYCIVFQNQRFILWMPSNP